MPEVAVADLSASYGSKQVLRGLSLQVGGGKVVSLIGPSGSGKSTVLRVLLGLLPPDGGRVTLDGHVVDYVNRRDVKALRDRCAIVFQQCNLFQNMTVMENIAITPVRIRGRNRRDLEAEASTLLDLVGLSDKARAYPDELSGGQQQRVAIARALALRPEFLFLEEVTAALDPELVSEVLAVIRGLAADGMSMLIVSHEMAFVREVASEVVFMADGAVVETGPPAQILSQPTQRRTPEFTRRILSL